MKKKMGIIALAAMMLGGVGLNALPTQTASAAWVETDPVTSSALSGNELDSRYWRFEEGIYLENNKIVFSKDTYEEARIFHRTELNARVEKSTYTINATIEVAEMVGNKRFGVGFGFDRSNYVVGRPNTNYFYVEKSDSGYVAGLCSYDANRIQTEHATPVSLSGSSWAVELVASYPNHVTAKIAGQTVYSGTVSAEEINGYFGFLETGDTLPSEYAVAYVSNLTVSNDYYLTPTNVNINDDFNDNSVDTSAWYVYNNPNNMSGIAETDGMLQFVNAKGETITTRYKYSNFELRMDIPYVKKHTDYNTNGTILSGQSASFGIFCGIDTDLCSDVGEASKFADEFSFYLLSFQSEDEDKNGALETTVAYGLSTEDELPRYSLPKKYDLWDENNENKSLNVVFTCLDGVYNMDIKWADETEYYHVFTVSMPARTGFISLYGNGSGVYCSNFALDNVKITNRDYKGDVLSGLFTESEDATLEDGDYGYADSKSPAQLVPDGTDFDGVQAVGEDDDGCSSAVDFGGIAIASLACVALLRKRRGE